MNMQQLPQSQTSSNGFGRRRVDREMGTRLENKSHSGRTYSNNFIYPGQVIDGTLEGFENLSRDRFIYSLTCLIGRNVEVQVKNGSIFSGIFHASNTDKDVGIVLKMARLIKDASFRGSKPFSDSVNKPPSNTLIVPAKELVQVFAKDVFFTENGSVNRSLQEQQQPDLMLDSTISQSRYVDIERELKRWIPDEEDPQCPELENIFDVPWNRNWDQFETNESLFGVKSTYNEELYTTKLDRGPQMRELEKEASRIAREIEGEGTRDLHLSEERGFLLPADFDVDEETKYSSVFRRVGDEDCNEHDDPTLDACTVEAFEVSKFPDSDILASDEDIRSQISTMKEFISDSGTPSTQKSSNSESRASSAIDGNDRLRDAHIREPQAEGSEEPRHQKVHPIGGRSSKIEEAHHLANKEKDGSSKVGLSASATSYSPSTSFMSSVGEEDIVEKANKLSSPTASMPSTSCTSSTSEGTQSSSKGFSSSEKSTLNPNAKEFKFNPNAKGFTPMVASLHPPHPGAEGGFYFPPNPSPIPHTHNVQFTPPFGGHQPVIYNNQTVPISAPQGYIQPIGPMYGQQMMLGHPRQVMFHQVYPPDMHYNGRDF